MTPTTPPPPPTITSVGVDTNFPYVLAGTSVTFRDTITGTGAFTAGVAWFVNGVAGGDAINGTIDGQGYYTAPAIIPPTNPVTVKATALGDSTKSASTTVSVFTLTYSPANPVVDYGHPQQFTAIVNGVSNPVVQWQCGYGRFSADGLYTPGSIQGPTSQDPFVVSIKDGNAPVSGVINLKLLPPTLTSITPAGASGNQPVVVQGHDLFGVASLYFTGIGGALIPGTVQSSNQSTELDATVPFGAIDGPVYGTFNLGPGFVNTSNSIPFSRLANLRIRAPQKDVSSGESEQFAWRLLGANSPTVINWTADLGTIDSNGLYQAPTVSSETFATVTGCLPTTASCDSTVLRVLPLVIRPPDPLVAMGNGVQLDAEQGGNPVSAQWSTTLGSVTGTGLFTAPTTAAQAGPIPVTATVGTTAQTTSVGVTGAFPGIVNRVYDYIKAKNQGLAGTIVRNVAVNGNLLYAFDQGGQFNKFTLSAIDVYDITNPQQPIWVDAVENPLYPTDAFVYGTNLYVVYFNYYYPTSIATFDIRSRTPVLTSIVTLPVDYALSVNGGMLYGLTTFAPQVNWFTADTYDVRSGSIVQNHYELSLPPGIGPNFLEGVVGSGNLMYVVLDNNPGSNILYTIATYDISVSPPKLVGTVLSNGGAFPSLFGNLLFVEAEVFDISGGIPQHVSRIPSQYVMAMEGNSALSIGYDFNYQLIDFTDTAIPVVKSSVIGGQSNGQFAGNQFFAPAALGGIVTYDLSVPGGPIESQYLAPFGAGAVVSQVMRNTTMFAVGADEFGTGGLDIIDLGSTTPSLLGYLWYPNTVGYAIALSGNNAFLGLTDSLKTVNITNLSSPTVTASLSLPVATLALSGNYLFAGTADKRLVSVNVTNPNSPTIAGTVSLPDVPNNMRIAGGLLLVADGPSGLLIYDVTQPTAPKLLSQYKQAPAVWDAVASGSQVLLAADASGLVILDISNPNQPVQLGQSILSLSDPFDLPIGPPTAATAIALQNGIVYVGTVIDSAMVFGFDFSQPSSPRLVSQAPYSGVLDSLVTGFAFVGNNIYVAGATDAGTLIGADNTLPRNSINPFYSPLALATTNSSPRRPVSPLARLRRKKINGSALDKKRWVKRFP